MPSSPRHAERLGELATHLHALPGVFSTAQWGGRAFKVESAPGRRSRPKMLAFLRPDPDAGVVHLAFKLERARAEAVVEKYDWIEPHSFRTLGGAGWVAASVRTKRHQAAVLKLLDESRTLYPVREDTPAPEPTRAMRGTSDEARRIDRVMGEISDWQPADDDGADWS